MPEHTTYRLVPPATIGANPLDLDADQRRVVDHESGPLLVLAGPGTGKTSTLVEAIAERIEHRGVHPDAVLGLTFSRKAAEHLRDRVAARVGITLAGSTCSTFHSFAYGLIRQWTPRELYDEPLRLLSAPEQDVVLQQILTREAESITWPDAIAGALGTRGFAAEVAQVIARAQEKGLGWEAIRDLGRREGLPEFVAAAAFMEQYDVVSGSQNFLDYASLIATAVRMLQDPDQPVLDELRRRYTHVFVDEYQDTDPAQVALLRTLTGDHAPGGPVRELVVVGDPHQSIYGFRGAEVRGILEFPTTFRRADGEPADTVVLGTTRRFGSHILRPAQRIAARLPLPAGVPTDALRRFLDPSSEAEANGSVELRTYDNDRAEAEHVADLLRRAHLEEGLSWSDMAVLVRSGRTTIPGLRRALLAAGVPVDVAADDTPLVREPAVAPLLDALAIAVDAGVADADDPAYVDPARAADLLASPLADMDASDVRVLARRLRGRERVVTESQGRRARSSPQLVREALLDPAVLADVTDPSHAERRAMALAILLRTVRDELAAGATVEQALWVLWSGTSWPERLQRATRQGGVAARMAHRDLDAVVALFDAASRAEDKQEHTSAETFLHTLRAQQIPADTLAERGVRGDAVRLLTAHRAKGLEWPLVVVAHVQEDAWPDLRRRATLLRADRIGVGGRLVPATTTRELLADERRLFYVACTRARRRLVVTAVASTDDEGEQPSRFLAELYPGDDGHRITHVEGRPRRPLSLAGLVAELRRTAADDHQPDALRDAAAARLAGLIREHRAGAVRVPGADPATWWGTHPWSAGDQPLRPVDEPVVVSASALTSLTTCPAQWFLNREAGAERATTQAQGFGNVVHALADRIGRGDETMAGRTRDEVVDALMAHVDDVWGQIPFRTPWSSGREREEVRQALDRFLVKHGAAARELVGTEVPLRAEVELPDGQRVQLHGYADRLELDTEGRVVVIDLKTGKTTPSQADIADHPQLGLYQLAVEHGAVEKHREPGGAELWQLRQEVGGAMRVQTQGVPQPDGDGARIIERQLMEAARRLRAEDFPARPGTHCAYCAFERFCPARTAGTVLQ